MGGDAAALVPVLSSGNQCSTTASLIALGVLGPDRLARYTRVLFDQYPCTQV